MALFLCNRMIAETDKERGKKTCAWPEKGKRMNE